MLSYKLCLEIEAGLGFSGDDNAFKEGGSWMFAKIVKISMFYVNQSCKNRKNVWIGHIE